MGTADWLRSLCLICLMAGCAACGVSGQFLAGRQALLANDSERALAYFLEAAQGDPEYVYRSMLFSEGIWTYVGRTQYATGRLQEARQSLERALALDKDDNLAKLYLGLTVARSGDFSWGLKNIESGMRGLYDWLEYINRSRPFEGYWDPSREIRNAIDNDLAAIAGGDYSREQIIPDAEWVGQMMENEIDRARRDERRQFDRDFERRRGISAGVGIGF
jgi:tetratricopeptide (TPR) repeat protein